jgi:hypothetical protein
MSPIGRILIVVNLLLAAAFLGWASQTVKVSQDYKAQLESLEASSQSEKQDLESQLTATNAQLGEQRRAAESARAEAEKNNALAQQLQSQLNDASAANGELRSELQGLNSRLDDLARSVDSATERAATAESDARDAIVAKEDAEDAQREAELAQRDAEDRVRSLESQVAALQSKNDGLAGDLTVANGRLDAVAAMTGIDMTTVLEVPALDRDVIAVRLDLAPGFVSINAGSQDGVRRGMVFQIYRGANYKGEVRVESVTEGACSAVVTTTVNGQSIASGDKATTAL